MCFCRRYAVRESSTRIKIFKNFKEKKAFKPEFGADGIFGGQLLGVRSSNSLSFYDWESLELVRRIEIVAKSVSLASVRCHLAFIRRGLILGSPSLLSFQPKLSPF